MYSGTKPHCYQDVSYIPNENIPVNVALIFINNHINDIQHSNYTYILYSFLAISCQALRA